MDLTLSLPSDYCLTAGSSQMHGMITEQILFSVMQSSGWSYMEVMSRTPFELCKIFLEICYRQ